VNIKKIQIKEQKLYNFVLIFFNYDFEHRSKVREIQSYRGTLISFVMKFPIITSFKYAMFALLYRIQTVEYKIKKGIKAQLFFQFLISTTFDIYNSITFKNPAVKPRYSEPPYNEIFNITSLSTLTEFSLAPYHVN